MDHGYTMNMEPKISIITLGVNGVQKSYDFYSKLNGLSPEKGIEGDIVFFNLNYMVLGLCPRDKLAEDACETDDGSGFSGITLYHNVKSKQEVDAIIEKLLSWIESHIEGKFEF
jgi:hypothetical protein